MVKLFSICKVFIFLLFVTFFYFDSFVFGSILLYEKKNWLFKRQTGIFSYSSKSG